MTGALAGIKIVEFAGIGPGPHTAMMLADLGAEVVRVERKGAPESRLRGDGTTRGRVGTIYADLKDADNVEEVRGLVARADVLIEGFRPGVMERLGLGPEVFENTNSRLIYGRITGWGQDGPWADRPGHDINYISVTGLLEATGSKEDPTVPLNLYGDFGGGSMFLVTGILAALVERNASGKGQVIDAAIVDGASLLAQMMWTFRSSGMWREERQSNILDGGAPFYGVYRTSDERHMAVGAIEPQFYSQLLLGLGLDIADLPHQHDVKHWQGMKNRFAKIFADKTQEEWQRIFDPLEACVTPVLNMTEALDHGHLTARRIFSGDLPDTVQVNPAPRLSRSNCPVAEAKVAPRISVGEILARWER